MEPPRNVEPCRNTEILKKARRGDRAASADLLEAVYDKLRLLAAAAMRRERRDHTLEATALVHEAYLKLIDETRVEWQDRAHFVSIAACAMRRILVEHARRRGARKRGGDRQRVPLRDTMALSGKPDLDILALDDALSALEKLDTRMARVVELRFFGGLGFDETASGLGVSARTAKEDWYAARAWLHRELTRGESEE